MTNFRILFLAPLAALATFTIGFPAGGQEIPASPMESGFFDHDMQFFAPADLSEFGNGPEAPIGWYFSYNRTFINISSPRNIPQVGTPRSNRGGWGWGNRYDIGFMTEENKGWLLEIFRTSVPVTQETNSVALNRVYRLEPLHNGGIIETFFGPRFISFQDRLFTFPAGVSTVQSASNDMVGGQVGFRYFQSCGRWTLSSQIKGFAGENFQDHSLGTPVGTAEEFVWAGDLRCDAAYTLTKDISLTGGFQVLGFGQGIMREAIPLDNDHELTIAGFAFGFEINR